MTDVIETVEINGITENSLDFLNEKDDTKPLTGISYSNGNVAVEENTNIIQKLLDFLFSDKAKTKEQEELSHKMLDSLQSNTTLGPKFTEQTYSDLQRRIDWLYNNTKGRSKTTKEVDKLVKLNEYLNTSLYKHEQRLEGMETIANSLENGKLADPKQKKEVIKAVEKAMDAKIKELKDKKNLTAVTSLKTERANLAKKSNAELAAIYKTQVIEPQKVVIESRKKSMSDNEVKMSGLIAGREEKLHNKNALSKIQTSKKEGKASAPQYIPGQAKSPTTQQRS